MNKNEFHKLRSMSVDFLRFFFLCIYEYITCKNQFAGILNALNIRSIELSIKHQILMKIFANELA